MPQISQLADTYASQIFWVLIFFGFVFFVIGKGMVPKVMETVAARDGQIAADLAFAEAARRAAEGAEASWQATAARQRNDAHADRQGQARRRPCGRNPPGRRRQRHRCPRGPGRCPHRRRRKDAMAEIETVASEAAGDIASRLAGITVGADAARAAVKEVLHG
jgi:F-type H+-transporting ATPase subunit b